MTNLTSSSAPMLFAGSLSKPGTVTVNGTPAAFNPHTTNFTGYATVSPGTNVVQVAATDPYGNTGTTNYQIVVTNNGVAQTLLYDLNGNLTTVVTATSTNSYEWDAADRLTAINMGTNRSEFSYDGSGRRVQIVEKQDGAVVSTKKFLWCGMGLCEERDATGANVTKRFFAQGQVNGATNLFYTRDHLGSVREMTDANGMVRARYDYDPFGRTTKVSGDLEADFLFTGDYYHAPSGLFPTMYRAYDPSRGRWLNRDPIGESGGINLYAYVGNNPINGIDPLGLWNLWNPDTWGDANPTGWSLLNSLTPWHESSGYTWQGIKETTSEADAAFLDGLIPFGDPFKDLYDPCDKSLQWSKNIGGWTRDAELTLAIPNIGTWIKNPLFYELGQVTAPKAIYQSVSFLGPIERGAIYYGEYGLSGFTKLPALASKADWAATVFPNWSGLTPGGGLLFVAGVHAIDSGLARQFV